MFYKVFQRDPFLSFFNEDDEDDFVTGMDAITDSPFRMAPLGILAMANSPAVFRGKQCNKGSLKRKCCNCHKEDQEVEPQANNRKSSEDSPNAQGPSSCKEMEIPSSKKTRFEVNLNVDRHYKPGELKVKLSPDNRSLTVEGSREECQKTKNGFSRVSSSMLQRIPLPKDVDIEGLKCDLNEKGVMMISAPTKLPALEKRGKEIPVTICLGGKGKEEITEKDIQQDDKGKQAEEGSVDSSI